MIIQRERLCGALVAVAAAVALLSQTGAGASQPRLSKGSAVPPAAIAFCNRFNLKACSPEGFTFLCYNHYPDEPGDCTCEGGFWVCG
ncbi:MAG: hypothetical protein U0002_14015 [Thermoanaerobaculia bacterium]